MRFLSFFLLLTVCFVTFIPQSHALRFTGDYLLNMCSSDEKGKEITKGGHLACQAYIAGVLDYHNLIRSMGVAPSVDFCVPEKESMGVLQQKVAKYLQRYKNQHGPFIASPAVALALFLYYPCNKK